MHIYRRLQALPTPLPREIESNLLSLLLSDWVSLLVQESFRPHRLKGITERIKRWLWGPVRAETSVGPGEVLSIVDGKVHVVQRVVRGAVDEFLQPMARDHVPVMDQDGPDLDGNEEDHVKMSLHWANEDEDALEAQKRMAIEGNSDDGLGYSLVWQRLHISIKRVESQRSPWRRN